MLLACQLEHSSLPQFHSDQPQTETTRRSDSQQLNYRLIFSLLCVRRRLYRRDMMVVTCFGTSINKSERQANLPFLLECTLYRYFAGRSKIRPLCVDSSRRPYRDALVPRCHDCTFRLERATPILTEYGTTKLS